MQTKEYATLVYKLLDSAKIYRRSDLKDIVILERIARGGGATNWYYCSDKACLKVIENQLSPGSIVSFYFDNRIRNTMYSEAINSEIEEIIINTGDCVIGSLEKDNVSIDVDFITEICELDEFVSSHTLSSRFFYGPFPARDNDGENAITITLPDDDGIIRAHPH